jgi:hypothetical protein
MINLVKLFYLNINELRIWLTFFWLNISNYRLLCCNLARKTKTMKEETKQMLKARRFDVVKDHVNDLIEINRAYVDEFKGEGKAMVEGKLVAYKKIKEFIKLLES